MKKLSILLFSLILAITVSNANACGTCGCQNDKVEINSESNSSNTEAIKCDKKSSSKKCCKSKSSSNKSKGEANYNFNKSNNYSVEKSSCDKKANKKSCTSKKGAIASSEGPTAVEK